MTVSSVAVFVGVVGGVVGIVVVGVVASEVVGVVAGVVFIRVDESVVIVVICRDVV